MWRGDKGAFIVELAVEDWEALGKLKASVRWTFAAQEDPIKGLKLLAPKGLADAL
jgi:hypothetical protein